MDILHQDLADALRHTTGDLAVNQEWVEDDADVINDAVTRDLDHTGVRIDLYFADMGAIREVLLFQRENRGLDQAWFQPFRQLRRIGSSAGDVADGDGLVSFLRRENPVFEFQIVDADLEHMRGNLLSFRDDLVGGGGNGRSAGRRRAGAAGALAEEDRVGVAGHIGDVLWINAEAVAHDLLEGSLVPLALIVRAGKERDRTGAVETDFRALIARAGGALDRIGEAKPAQLAVLKRFRTALRKAMGVRHVQRIVHVLGEFARIVSEGQASLERHRAGRDGILPPQLGWINTEL